LATTVVQRLVESYDVNYGARSVMNEAKTLAIQILAESQIRGDIGKKYASYFVRLFNISHANHTNSWLVHLFINDAGDIDMAKEDPNGKLQ
jgi:ATP-dependent Clp protease ATP-binding subunit ClpB